MMSWKIMNRIGIYTLGDLQRFAKEEQRKGETLEQSLKRYLKELGNGFKIKEELINGDDKRRIQKEMGK